jgi:hypothetical protein
MYPIYIPSCGRGPLPKTAQLLRNEEIPFYVVVEPRERESYGGVGEERLLTLPENRQGIAYVRNWIKRHSIDNHDACHWQLDDDVTAIQHRTTASRSKCSFRECLESSEQIMERYSNLAGIGIHNAAFIPKRAWSWNQQIYSIVLFNNAVDAWWHSDCIEDTDYSLQCLSQDWCTLLVNEYEFFAPTTGTKSGGTSDTDYSQDGRVRKIRGLARRWPGLGIKVHRGFGLPKAKTAHIWRKFAIQPKKR